MSPRDSAMRQYEAAFEHLVIAEERVRAYDPDAASDVHEIGLSVVRARNAEETNPPTPPLEVHCLTCAAAYAAGGSA